MIKHSNYNCKIITDTGETHLVYGHWMHNEGLDSFKDWHCEAGYTRFHIDKNFDIWSGQCLNDHLGNLLDDWNIKTDTICQQTFCSGCTDDLIAKKHQP